MARQRTPCLLLTRVVVFACWEARRGPRACKQAARRGWAHHRVRRGRLRGERRSAWLSLLAAVWLSQPTAQAELPAFTPVFRGVDYRHERVQVPRPLRIHAVRIDLKDPAIGFLVTPPNGDEPKEVNAMRTSTFLARHKCQVAINGSPFRPYAPREGWPQDIVGLSISQGEAYSRAHPLFGALLISKNRRAWIAQPAADTSNAYNAVGGFHVLVADGENVARSSALHPRTTVGITRDGRYLLLVVIDGRQPGYSEGVTLGEAAGHLVKMGAYQGLNLDGGGSTTLVIEGSDGKPRTLNRPIAIRGIPGSERPVGNHLGVYAKRLAEPATRTTHPTESGSVEQRTSSPRRTWPATTRRGEVPPARPQ